MISLVRADDRLVHGLVAVSWTNQLHPDILLVANDHAANDAMSKMTMKLAKPAGVTLGIKDLKSAIAILNNSKYANKKIFVVTENVRDALTLKERVERLKNVNVGTAGIHYQDAVAVLPQVKMTEDEFACAQKLDQQGVEVFAQVNPTTEKLNFSGIKKAFNK
ncbi:PTS sugar transporter subunit IIB [Lactobacillus sp. ESL0681]|uniref:PTS sugar transporter subunit IIB n=1 Tax=Lactobacillus sp. ESL0681 TaxID=2983211 RepID=UPI0023F75C75|nr:PTS sugar transporter subunit IIB [Lactobacillus sp. ESL0681]WEV40151.1 PTS sugar transporter subunit IIB [Lactobacillus sp. ESL0681]